MRKYSSGKPSWDETEGNWRATDPSGETWEYEHKPVILDGEWMVDFSAGVDTEFYCIHYGPPCPLSWQDTLEQRPQ